MPGLYLWGRSGLVLPLFRSKVYSKHITSGAVFKLLIKIYKKLVISISNFKDGQVICQIVYIFCCVCSRIVRCVRRKSRFKKSTFERFSAFSTLQKDSCARLSAPRIPCLLWRCRPRRSAAGPNSPGFLAQTCARTLNCIMQNSQHQLLPLPYQLQSGITSSLHLSHYSYHIIEKKTIDFLCRQCYD